MKILPRRRTILQCSQIFLTEVRTFIIGIARLSGLLIAVGYTPAAEIVRRQFHGDFVAGQNLDKMHSHFARDVTENFMSIFQNYSKRSIGETFLDHAVNLNRLFFGNTKPQ